MIMLFIKSKEKSYDLPYHNWLCSAEICEETLKKIQKVFINESNIREWENKLEQCNECFLNKKHSSNLNRLTRWTISSEIHSYKSVRKK